jgi:ubiquinone/menaquinone biosynthesis C-methylase UbiE
MGSGFPVHLVGSVPMTDAEAVFQACARLLGNRLSRLPDGETGYRSDWLAWQLPVFRSCPQFEVVPGDPPDYRPRARVRLRKGVEAGSIQLERLGYAAAARQSYALFERLKRQGKLPPGYIFQVSLPTPVGPVGHLVAPQSQAAVEPVYEHRLLAELDEMLEAIPHDQLAVQWDTAIEFALLEGVFPSWFDDIERGVVRRLLRLARRVPADVQLGFHLCYGDAGHRHFKDPEDASRMVAIAGQLSAGLERTLDWVHMPVPRHRTDDAYFAPLRDLKLGPETELYLGLVHYTDGVYGARRRLATAERFVTGFGIATECGLGRRPPETISDILRMHAELSAAPRVPKPVFKWPADFPRFIDDDWSRTPVDSFGLQYDSVENHGWYVNLEPTVAQVHEYLEPGQVLVDYSGGTGIFVDRLFQRRPEAEVGVVIVDSSPKFLRVALEKFQDEERVAFRLVRYVKEEGRLQPLDEVLEPLLRPGGIGVDAVVSTNAIHLYYDLPETLASWARVLKPDRRTFIQSGNIRNPNANPGEWIIDETVGAIHEMAVGIVRKEPAYARYREVLADDQRMAAYAALREKFFLPVRPLEHYLSVLEETGFRILRVLNQTIEARVDEWYDFLTVYNEGVLGWVGGSPRVEGREPDEQELSDRLTLMRRAMDELFGGADSFPCCWTYIVGARAA